MSRRIAHLSELDDRDLDAHETVHEVRRGKKLRALVRLVRPAFAGAHPLGQRLYAERPRYLADHVEIVWQSWPAEQDWTSALTAPSGNVRS